VTKEVERAEEIHNKEYQVYEVQMNLLQGSLKDLHKQNLESRTRQKDLLTEIEEIEQLNKKLRETMNERESLILNLETLMKNGLKI